MRISHYFFGLCMLGIVALFSSCSGAPDSAKLLDEESFLVFRIDTRQFLEKSGFAEDGKAKSELKKLLKEMGGDETKFVTDLMDEPEKMGVNFADPIFIGFSGDRDFEVRVVGSVADDNNMTEFFNDLAKKADLDGKVKEVDDYRCLLFDSHSVLVYNSSSFMLRFFDSRMDDPDEKDQIKDAKKLFEGDGSNKLLEDNDFQEMCSRSGVAQMLFRGKGLAELRGSTELERELPDDLELKDIAYLMELSVDKREAVLTGEFLAGSDEWKKNTEQFMAVFGDIQAEYAEYISKENGALMVNINGEKLLDMLSDLGVKKEMGGDWRMLRDLLGSINGDAAIGFDNLSALEKDGYPSISAYVSTSDNKLISLVHDLLADDIQYSYSTRLDVSGTDKYQLYDTDDDVQLLFGFDDGCSYFAFGGSEAKAFGKVKKAFEKSDIKGKGVYAFLNFSVFKTIKDVLDEYDYEEKVVFDYLSKLFDYGEFYLEGDNGKFVLRVTNRDADKTPIEAMFENIYSFVVDMEEASRKSMKWADEDYATYYDDEDDYSWSADSVLEAPEEVYAEEAAE